MPLDFVFSAALTSIRITLLSESEIPPVLSSPLTYNTIICRPTLLTLSSIYLLYLIPFLKVVPDDDDVQNFLGEGNLRSSYYVAQENLLTIPTGINRLHTMLNGMRLLSDSKCSVDCQCYITPS
jgi:hypothetical protein